MARGQAHPWTHLQRSSETSVAKRPLGDDCVQSRISSAFAHFSGPRSSSESRRIGRSSDETKQAFALSASTALMDATGACFCARPRGRSVVCGTETNASLDFRASSNKVSMPFVWPAASRELRNEVVDCFAGQEFASFPPLAPCLLQGRAHLRGKTRGTSASSERRAGFTKSRQRRSILFGSGAPDPPPLCRSNPFLRAPLELGSYSLGREFVCIPRAATNELAVITNFTSYDRTRDQRYHLQDLI
jgi:hypothetical protein